MHLFVSFTEVDVVNLSFRSLSGNFGFTPLETLMGLTLKFIIFLYSFHKLVGKIA